VLFRVLHQRIDDRSIQQRGLCLQTGFRADPVAQLPQVIDLVVVQRSGPIGLVGRNDFRVCDRMQCGVHLDDVQRGRSSFGEVGGPRDGLFAEARAINGNEDWSCHGILPDRMCVLTSKLEGGTAECCRNLPEPVSANFGRRHCGNC